MKNILIVNPNSNASVTRGIEAALASLSAAAELHIDCTELDDGPFGVETDQDIEKVLPLIIRKVSANKNSYDAFIIACYSDPGLVESRLISRKQVFGIQESALSLSASHGRRFGVLALQRESIQRHISYVRQLGLREFHAGERPLDITVDQAVNDPQTLGKIIEIGRELIEEDGAETLILGCAGMAKHRPAAQSELGVPVIDPVLAAVELATQALR